MLSSVRVCARFTSLSFFNSSDLHLRREKKKSTPQGVDCWVMKSLPTFISLFLRILCKYLRDISWILFQMFVSIPTDIFGELTDIYWQIFYCQNLPQRITSCALTITYMIHVVTKSIHWAVLWMITIQYLTCKHLLSLRLLPIPKAIVSMFYIELMHQSVNLQIDYSPLVLIIISLHGNIN